MYNVRDIITYIESFENHTFEDDVQARLDKILNLYLREINNSYVSLLSKIDKKGLIREISKW